MPTATSAPVEKFTCGLAEGVAAVNAQFVASNSSIRHLYGSAERDASWSANPHFRISRASFLGTIKNPSPWSDFQINANGVAMARTPTSLYPVRLPLCWSISPAFGALWSGITWPAVAICFRPLLGANFLRLAPVITGTFRIEPIQPAGVSVPAGVPGANKCPEKHPVGAAKHRITILHSNTEQDVHRTAQRLLLQPCRLIFARQHAAADLVKVADLAAYPELMWLHQIRVASCRRAWGCLLFDCRLAWAGVDSSEYGAALPRTFCIIHWHMCVGASAT